MKSRSAARALSSNHKVVSSGYVVVWVKRPRCLHKDVDDGTNRFDGTKFLVQRFYASLERHEGLFSTFSVVSCCCTALLSLCESCFKLTQHALVACVACLTRVLEGFKLLEKSCVFLLTQQVSGWVQCEHDWKSAAVLSKR